jgi:hypothetical protein
MLRPVCVRSDFKDDSGTCERFTDEGPIGGCNPTKRIHLNNLNHQESVSCSLFSISKNVPIPAGIGDEVAGDVQLPDGRGLTKKRLRCKRGSTQQDLEASYTFDSEGRPWKLTYPDGSVVTHLYNTLGQMFRWKQGSKVLPVGIRPPQRSEKGSM